MANKEKVKKKKLAKGITSGTAHIQASFNNTIITITDTEGNVISDSTAGRHGFKGSKKSTPYRLLTIYVYNFPRTPVSGYLLALMGFYR